jgi:simple sugar transport system ATP-binding protein
MSEQGSVRESATAPLLALAGIVKQFPGCLANDRVDLTVMPGEIHALLGENGAGKSTLVKIIYGVLKPDSGDVRWHGQSIAISGPAQARELGIGMVFQHFSLFEALTVGENIALGLNKPEERQNLRERVLRISGEYGLQLDPDRAVHDLSVGERQRIEIVRCLLQQPKLLIMDEPTSVLTPQEVTRLFETLRRLSKEGCAILYISHKLEEIRALCERATIMRLGKVVAHCDPRKETARRLAELMIGAELKSPTHGKKPSMGNPTRLKVQALSARSEQQFGTDLKDISFEVKGGEILGIGGIAGNGQTELMAALSGETMTDPEESVVIDGVSIAHLEPRRRRSLGGCFVPEERNGHAAVREMTLSENAFLSAHVRRALSAMGLIREGRTAEFAADVIRSFDVRTTGPSAEARSLSGGNLQKFIVGREVLQAPSVLVVSQPTWGVDAGAASAIHQALIDLAENGSAVVVISQDLDEIFAICDRIAVLAAGRLSQAIPIGEASVEQIGLLMGGTHGAGESERSAA